MTNLFEVYFFKVARKIQKFYLLCNYNSIFIATKFTIIQFLNIRRIEKINLYGQYVLIRTGSMDFSVACDSLGDEFETVIELSSQDIDFIVDAGGYIGTAAMKFATSFPNALIVCIEPSSQNFELLEKNVCSFENIVPIQAAVSYQSNAEVTLRDRGTGNWGFTIVQEPNDSLHASEIEKVPAVTIDEIMKKFAKKEIGILKMDIEGAELEIFRHSATWINCVNILAVELHDRIITGCSEAFLDATTGRKLVQQKGEKVISVVS